VDDLFCAVLIFDGVLVVDVDISNNSDGGALVDVDQSNDSSGVVVACFDVCLSIKHATA